jgi:hypothetical protein
MVEVDVPGQISDMIVVDVEAMFEQVGIYFSSLQEKFTMC